MTSSLDAAVVRDADAGGGQTEQRILAEARKLFAVYGYNATTMRMICAAAEVNPSSVYHHFGSKQGVLRGVCEHLFEPVQRERAKRLAAVFAKPGSARPDLYDVLTAFIGPAIELARDSRLGATVNRLAGHLATDPTPEVRAVIATIHDALTREFVSALRGACPDLEGDQRFVALQCAFGALLFVQSDPGRIEQVSGLRLRHVDTQRVTELVVNFIAGGLQALSSPARDRGTR
jgi:AcrR family transcriptional regulator